MKKILSILSLFVALGSFGQGVTSDATIISNTNTLIRNATTVTRANHAMINDELTYSKLSRIESTSTSGSANTYTASISWLTSYASGTIIPIKFHVANTGASTININSLGAIALVKSGSVALSSGDIQTGQSFILYYDGTNFQLMGGGGSGGGSSYTFSSPLVNTAGTISITQATTSTNGFLTSTDWNTFNGKLPTANPAYTGVLSTGTLGFVDTNVLLSGQSSVNGYNQFIIQNTNSGSAASSDVIVANNNTTASTYYGDFGMNSSGFTGSGAFNAPNNVFLTSTSADLAIGTTTSNGIHFVVNGGATDAMTINSSGGVLLPSLTTNSLLYVNGSGVISPVTIGSNLTFSSGTLSASGGGSSYTFSTGLTNTTGTITSNLSTGIAGGQLLIGGTNSGDNMTYQSTSNATKGKHIFDAVLSNNFTTAAGYVGAVVEIPVNQQTNQYNGGGYVTINTAGSGYAVSGGPYTIVVPYSSGTSATSVTVTVYTNSSGQVTSPIYWRSGGTGADATTRWAYSGTLGGSGSGLTLKLQATDLRVTPKPFYWQVDQSYNNSGTDGQNDNVMRIGFNATQSSGNAAGYFTIEDHYIGGGIDPNGQIEFHLEGLPYDRSGANRMWSFGFGKSQKTSYMLMQNNSYNFASNALTGTFGASIFTFDYTAQASWTGSNPGVLWTNTAAPNNTFQIQLSSGNATFSNSANSAFIFQTSGTAFWQVTSGTNVVYNFNDGNGFKMTNAATSLNAYGLNLVFSNASTNQLYPVYATGNTSGIFNTHFGNTGTGDARFELTTAASGGNAGLYLISGSNNAFVLQQQQSDGSLRIVNSSLISNRGAINVFQNNNVTINSTSNLATLLVVSQGVATPQPTFYSYATWANGATAEVKDNWFYGVRATQYTLNGTIPLQRFASFEPPSSVTGSIATTTITDYAVLYADAPPTAGTNAVITNGWSLYANGAAKIVGKLQVNGGVSGITFVNAAQTGGGNFTAATGVTNVNPASTASTMTITMPASPNIGDIVTLTFGGTIAAGSTVVTTLTVSPNTGQSIYGALTLTTAKGGDIAQYEYTATNTWTRIK